MKKGIVLARMDLMGPDPKRWVVYVILWYMKGVRGKLPLSLHHLWRKGW